MEKCSGCFESLVNEQSAFISIRLVNNALKSWNKHDQLCSVSIMEKKKRKRITLLDFHNWVKSLSEMCTFKMIFVGTVMQIQNHSGCLFRIMREIKFCDMYSNCSNTPPLSSFLCLGKKRNFGAVCNQGNRAHRFSY